MTTVIDDKCLKNAIDLAEGWVCERTGNQRIKVFAPHGDGGPFPLKDIGYLDTQWVKDALAAQIVRQVDAIDGLELISQYNEVSIWDYDSMLCAHDSKDRTMNTIKAIVESGVLQQQRNQT